MITCASCQNEPNSTSCFLWNQWHTNSWISLCTSVRWNLKADHLDSWWLLLFITRHLQKLFRGAMSELVRKFSLVWKCTDLMRVSFYCMWLMVQLEMHIMIPISRKQFHLGMAQLWSRVAVCTTASTWQSISWYYKAMAKGTHWFQVFERIIVLHFDDPPTS